MFEKDEKWSEENSRLLMQGLWMFFQAKAD